MRVLILLFGLFFATLPVTEGTAAASPSKERVAFDGIILELASEGSISGDLAKEYLCVGEKPDAWTSKASIREDSRFQSPKEAAIKLLESFRRSDPQSPCAIWQAPNEAAIVELFSVSTNPHQAELTIVRFSKAGRGVVAERYSRRVYTDDKEAQKELFLSRRRLIDLLGTRGLSKMPNKAPEPTR
jgi:hypothetical protein